MTGEEEGGNETEAIAFRLSRRIFVPFREREELVSK